jgi:cytidylate kinase
MPTAARFDSKVDAHEKGAVAKTAAVPGSTMAGWVRVAAVALLVDAPLTLYVPLER